MKTVVYVIALIAFTGITVLVTVIGDREPPPKLVRFEDGLIPVMSPISGKVQLVCVKAGSSVKLGDALIELDMRDLLRHKALIESRIHIAEVNRPEVRSTLSDLYGELQQTNVDLSGLTITSPADGEIISIVPFSQGEHLVAGTAVAVVGKRKALETFASSAFC